MKTFQEWLEIKHPDFTLNERTWTQWTRNVAAPVVASMSSLINPIQNTTHAQEYEKIPPINFNYAIDKEEFKENGQKILDIVSKTPDVFKNTNYKKMPVPEKWGWGPNWQHYTIHLFNISSGIYHSDNPILQRRLFPSAIMKAVQEAKGQSVYHINDGKTLLVFTQNPK